MTRCKKKSENKVPNTRQEARRLVVAMIQHVTYAEYLPLVLGRYARRLRLSPLNSGYSSTYSPGIDATVANVFGTAAFR